MHKIKVNCTFTAGSPYGQTLYFTVVPRVGEYVNLDNKEYIIDKLIHDFYHDRIEINLTLTEDFSE